MDTKWPFISFKRSSRMFYSCVHGTCIRLPCLFEEISNRYRYPKLKLWDTKKRYCFQTMQNLHVLRTVWTFAWKKNSSFEIYMYRKFSEYYRYNVDTPLRVVFNDDNLFKDDLLSRHATIRDLLSHRMGIPGNNAIRLDTNLTRENLIQ